MNAIEDIISAIQRVKCAGEEPDTIWMPEPVFHRLTSYRFYRTKGNSRQRRIRKRRQRRVTDDIRKSFGLEILR